MNQDQFFARWAQFFLDRYRLTLLLVVAITVAGIWGVNFNQRQDYPSIQANFVQVSVVYPQASARQIEEEALVPLEQAIAQVEDIASLRSSASANWGGITVEISEIDLVEARAQQISEAVSQTVLPAEAEVNVEITDPIGPTLIYAVASDTASTEELFAAAETVKGRLENLTPDIRKIEVQPEHEFVINVTLDADQMREFGITGAAVNETLRGDLARLPGGLLSREDDSFLPITLAAPLQTIDEIRALEIAGHRLESFASVEREPTAGNLQPAGFLVDGEPVSTNAVYLAVYKQADGDVLRLSDAIAAERQAIEDEQVLAEEITVALVYESAPFVRKQISDLIWNGWLGLLLILLVLMLFINLRTALAVATIIPLSFLSTLAILYGLGYTINTLTLFGMLLVLGILVDNAIVIAEGITQALESGKKKREAIIGTVRDIGPAVTAATLTTVVAFIPFAYIGGLVGAFLRFIPITIIIMLLTSYALALTVMPLVAQFLLKERTKAERQGRRFATWEKVLVLPLIVHGGQRLIDELERWYGQFAGYLTARPWRGVVTVLVAVGLIVGSVTGYATRLKVEQFPSDDSNAVTIEFDFPQQANPDETQAAIHQVMEQAIQTPYFKSYIIMGRDVQVLFAEPHEREAGNDIAVLLADLEERTRPAADELAKQEISFHARTLGVGPPSERFDVIVELTGRDLTALSDAVGDLASFARSQAEVTEVVVSTEEDSRAEVRVDFDPQKLADAGIDPLQAQGAVNAFFGEQTVGNVLLRADGIPDDVVVGTIDDQKRSLDDIRELVIGVQGFPPRPATVGDFANVEETTELGTIRRLNQQRLGAVRIALAEGEDAAAFEQRVRDYLTADQLKTFGLTQDDVAYGGFAANAFANFEDLQLVFIIAMIAVYLILVYQFNSFLQPMLILTTVPLALIGVFPGLFTINSSVNMISGLGIVALVGIVVNDAIVFVDYFNRLRRSGAHSSLAERLVATGQARFKPILSTSITTVFGILPLTIADPFWRGLGTSLTTGLICSTIGTLVVFPILLGWSEQFLARFSRRKKS